MKPTNQLAKLREKLKKNAALRGQIVEVDSDQVAHKHGKETVIIRFNKRIGEIEYECDCGIIFKRKQ